MHRISFILLIFLSFLTTDSYCEDEDFIDDYVDSPVTEEPMYSLDIPDTVIIERHNATDYIASDNVKHHVMGVSDERCDNAHVSVDYKIYDCNI
jgi:hypothetical protein